MEFMNLADVTKLDEVPEGASVLAATTEGDIVRVPGEGLGGSGGGADWNAVEGQPGYIANKPFGVEQEKLKLADVLTIEFTATATDDGNGNTVYVADISQYFSTIARITSVFGDQFGPYGDAPMFYSLDGVEYDLAVSDYNDMGVSYSRAFGNASLRKPDGTDTGEPMYLSVWSPGDYNHQAMIYVADNKPHSVSFYAVAEEVSKLNAKFVPSNVIDYFACVNECESETEGNIAVYNAANEIFNAGQMPVFVKNSNVYVLTIWEPEWSFEFTNFNHNDVNVYVHSFVFDVNGGVNESFASLCDQGE